MAASSNPNHCTRTIFYGPVSLTCFDILPYCLLSIDPSGKIEWMIDNIFEHQLQETLAPNELLDFEIVILMDGEFLMPGLINTHVITRCSPIVRDLA